MGGSVNKKMSANVTHLVAHTVFGTKYKVMRNVVTNTCILSTECIVGKGDSFQSPFSLTQDAVVLGTPIMSEQWVWKCWEERLNTAVSARAPHLVHAGYSDFQASYNAKAKSVECHLHALMF